MAARRLIAMFIFASFVASSFLATWMHYHESPPSTSLRSVRPSLAALPTSVSAPSLAVDGASFLGTSPEVKTVRALRESTAPEHKDTMKRTIVLVPRNELSPKLTIGYAVTMTKSSTGAYLDGAAVLGHSIYKAHQKSQFNYALVAIVHQSVDNATRTSLALLGWQVEAHDVPVVVEKIEGDYLRGRIRNNGCCGERELLKLWAYTFSQFHRVVHLDTDSLVLQSMDELFDVRGEYDRYGALFTYDWNMARRGKNPPVQGGFIVLQPNTTVFEELTAIVRVGDFRPGYDRSLNISCSLILFFSF